MYYYYYYDDADDDCFPFRQLQMMLMMTACFPFQSAADDADDDDCLPNRQLQMMLTMTVSLSDNCGC